MNRARPCYAWAARLLMLALSFSSAGACTAKTSDSTRLKLVLEIADGFDIDQIKIESVLLNNVPLPKSMGLFPAKARALKNGDALTMLFDDDADEKTATTTAAPLKAGNVVGAKTTVTKVLRARTTMDVNLRLEPGPAQDASVGSDAPPDAPPQMDSPIDEKLDGNKLDAVPTPCGAPNEICCAEHTCNNGACCYFSHCIADGYNCGTVGTCRAGKIRPIRDGTPPMSGGGTPDMTATDGQFVLIDEEATWTENTDAVARILGPSDWISPNDYYDGQVYMRYEVVNKPSMRQVGIQVCLWQQAFTGEICSTVNSCLIYSDANPGVMHRNLGSPSMSADWYVSGNPLDFRKKIEVAALVHKDGNCGGTLLSSSASNACGSYCYQGADIADHTPIKFKVKVIAVAKGFTFKEPSGW